MQETVYLLHFSDRISPDHTTQHYLGYTDDLARRLAEHRAGCGARLCEVAKDRGIAFVVARLWTGNRGLERQLKNRHNAPQLCPICQQERAALDTVISSLCLADVPELEF